MSNTAVFFDRDGTLVRAPGYLTDPDKLELLEGAAEALRHVQALGYKTVVVSNQPCVARGIVTEEMLERIHQRLRELVLRHGASLDAIYYCPYDPDGSVAKYRQDSDWRKPRPGMLLAAAEQMDIDLDRSWMVGDSPRDVEAGRRAGCKTILIRPALPAAEGADGGKPDHVAVDVREAVNIIKEYHRSGQDGHIVPMFADAQEPVSVPASAEGESAQPYQASDPSDAPAATETEEAPTRSETVEQLLATILEQLKRMQKAEMFDEFSLLRLLAGIMQVFVPFCLLIALWLLTISDQPGDSVVVALGFAGVLQLMALTFYIMHGRR